MRKRKIRKDRLRFIALCTPVVCIVQKKMAYKQEDTNFREETYKIQNSFSWLMNCKSLNGSLSKCASRDRAAHTSVRVCSVNVCC
jgi:hypothetical protein